MFNHGDTYETSHIELSIPTTTAATTTATAYTFLNCLAYLE